MSKLEAALNAARKGFRIFPLVPNGKTPAFEGWQIAATIDENRISQWWAPGNRDCNIGILLDGLAAVDVDPKNGGKDTFLVLAKALGFNHDENKTLLAETASGGHHFIYRLPEGLRLKSRAHQFGQGVDLKSGAGAYIVAAGSTIDGNAYKWVNDRPVREMLLGLIERAQIAKERSPDAGKRLVEEDDWAIERAERYIREEAPTVSDGEGRDDTGIEVSLALYDFGVEEPTAKSLLHDWNQTKCFPPKDDGAVERWARSGLVNRLNPVGWRHPDNARGFEPTEIAPRPFADAGLRAESEKRKNPEKFKWLTAEQSSALALAKPREWLVENVLHVGGEAVLIGKPGSGKSFFVLDLLYHIAADRQFAGSWVRKGPCVYIASEAQWGAHLRIRALELHYGPLTAVPLVVIPEAPDLAHGKEDARALIARLKEIEAYFGQPIAMFAIDTLNRVLAGSDENSSKDMGSVLEAVRHMRAETGAASMVVHHPGWGSDRARGHSSMFGAVDSELRIANHLMTVEKLRDGKEGHKVRFAVRPIRTDVKDGRGQCLTSCYVDAGIAEEMRIEPSGAEAEVLAKARELSAGGKPIRASDPEKSGNSGFSGLGNSDTIRKHLKELEKKGWLKKHTHGQWVIA